MKNKFKILVITPIRHISNLENRLKKIGSVDVIKDINVIKFKKIISNYNIIFTNPNKSKVFLGYDNLKSAKKLKIICTASTGTNHIDLNYAKTQKIKIISLTKEIKTLRKITSTAELATTFSIMAVRRVFQSNISVLNKEWDYERFIGRQFDELTVGVIGYGRLGKIYSKNMMSLGSKIYVYDPYVTIIKKNITKVQKLEELVKKCDIISLHVHVADETKNLISKNLLRKCKNNIIIINTSRGEIVNEFDIAKFLKNNSKAQYYTDVLASEINKKFDSPIFKMASNKKNNQIFITPHIGGMTNKAQQIAYNHAVELLIDYIKNNEQ